MENNFNFDITATSVFRSYKLWSFPLFRYANIINRLFLALFILSLFLYASSFLGFILQAQAFKISLLMLFFYLAFLEIELFVNSKIKNPSQEVPLSEVLATPEAYNAAESLDFQMCQAVQKAIKKSRKEKFPGTSSELLLYFCLQQKSDMQILLLRLGLDPSKLLQDLKNYLEKQKRGQQSKVLFSTSFKEAINEALSIASQRGKRSIGQKELLVALARHDDFFKKVLVEHDLKEKDVENITLWLDKIEEKIEKNKQFWTKENLSRFGSFGRDFASGFTVTLDAFSHDLTRAASKHIFGEIVGHQKEIEELEIILTKSSQSNALIIGDPGVGRKSIVEALAQRCFLKTGLPGLASKKVIELDMVALVSRIQDAEKLETTLDNIFQEVLRAGNVILVIDQLDQYAHQGVQKPGQVDISGILAKYLALPNFQFVGIASFDGLHRNLEQNSSFLEYFRKIEVLEVSELETIRILQNLALYMEQKYRILVVYPVIREIINLTARYLPSVPFPKKAIDVLDEAISYAKALNVKVVLPSYIAKIISDKTQIPIGKMEFKEKSILLDLEHLIHQRIIGQEEAVHEISIAMRRARSGLSSKKRPMGTFLFLGPTGVGKTETAKALAEIYFAGEDKMIRLDMSEFQSIADIPRLIGQISPVEEQGLLTTPVRENPFSLVLLDEIEKAHPNILNLFLQVFDEGHITDGQGRKIMFTNTIIICTSNAGADMIFKAVETGEALQKNTLFDVLFSKGIFKPEFINRFDAAVFFHPLTRENLLDIAQLNLESLAKNLKEKEIDFMITNPLKEKIVELSYKPEFGAREMRRVMQDKIENVIAQALLSDTIIKGDSIEINPENFEVVKIKSG